MLKFNQKTRDHIAKSVITPVSITVLVSLVGLAWKDQSILVLLTAIFQFLWLQMIAVMLLNFEDEGVDSGEAVPGNKSKN